MCGIIGYVGNRKAAELLLNGLRRLEYRGYDSAGISTFSKNALSLKKDTGKVDEIHKRVNFLKLEGTVGIGHTRWATHGGVTTENAHPHVSCNKDIAIVHNGIIENYQDLKSKLESRGHTFRSQTDSEVIVHLLEEYRSDDLVLMVKSTIKELRGSFGFLSLICDRPDTIVGVRKDSPLIIGIGNGENFIASDLLAFIEHTDRAIFLDNMEFALIKKGSANIYRFDGVPVVRHPTKVAWEVTEISRQEYRHYTLKEIHEQSQSIRMALMQDHKKVDELCERIRSSERTVITGSGTSFHAALMAKYLFGKAARIHAEVAMSSEFDQMLDFLDEKSVILAFSQSGETADALDAIRKAKKIGSEIISIVNALGSSLGRESGLTLYLNCGPEIGVAATKSFTAQLAITYLLSHRLAADTNGEAKLKDLPNLVNEVLKSEEQIINLSKTLAEHNDVYFVGRGPNYPIALEGALKLKELAYIHAEGMAAGELKHGPLALIHTQTPVVVINPRDETYDQTLSNAEEMKSRGAMIVGVSNEFNQVYDEFIKLPNTDNQTHAILEVIPLQLIAYYTSIEMRKDPDFPRNLAKSVTVR